MKIWVKFLILFSITLPSFILNDYVILDISHKNISSQQLPQKLMKSIIHCSNWLKISHPLNCQLFQKLSMRDLFISLLNPSIGIINDKSGNGLLKFQSIRSIIFLYNLLEQLAFQNCLCSLLIFQLFPPINVAIFMNNVL